MSNTAAAAAAAVQQRNMIDHRVIYRSFASSPNINRRLRPLLRCGVQRDEDAASSLFTRPTVMKCAAAFVYFPALA